MTAFGIFVLTLGLASGISLLGYTLLRVLMGSYLDTNLGVMWEAFSHTPYRPPSIRELLLGIAISFALCTIGALLTRPDRQAKFRRVVVTTEPPAPPAS